MFSTESVYHDHLVSISQSLGLRLDRNINIFSCQILVDGCYCRTWCNHNQRLEELVPACTSTGTSTREFRTVSSPLNPALTTYYPINPTYIQSRNFYLSPSWNGQEHSSKVEETVKSIKEQKEQEQKDKLAVNQANAITEPPTKAVAEKRTIWQKVKAEALHYYHGFRLLGLDMKVSAKLIWRILKGKDLSRREHRLVSLDFHQIVYHPRWD